MDQPHPNPMFLTPENNKSLDLDQLMMALEELECLQRGESRAQVAIPMESFEVEVDEQQRKEQKARAVREAREARRLQRRARRVLRRQEIEQRIGWFLGGFLHAARDALSVMAMCMVVALLLYLMWFSKA